MAIKSYRDLVAWQRSLDFIEEVYCLTRHFPPEERHALTDQLRRASVSVAGNIAEGSGRFTSRDLLNFLSHSRGSLKEAESHIFVSQRVKLITPKQCETALSLADEVSRLLFGLRMSIRTKQRKAGS
jgi:four helix bundle protein